MNRYMQGIAGYLAYKCEKRGWCCCSGRGRPGRNRHHHHSDKSLNMDFEGGGATAAAAAASGKNFWRYNNALLFLHAFFSVLSL